MPLQRKSVPSEQYSRSSARSHDEFENNFDASPTEPADASDDDLLSDLIRNPAVDPEGTIDEIMKALGDDVPKAEDDGEVDSSANPQPVQVDNSANPNPTQVDNSTKKSRPVSLLRDAAFLRAVEGLFASGIPQNQAGTSVIESFPIPPSDPPISHPSVSPTVPDPSHARLSPWWHRLQAPSPRSHRGPAEWRDTSDQLRVLYRHLALKTFGAVHTINVNLHPDIEALCRRQPDQAGWFQARVVRRLCQQLGRSPEFHLTMEEGDQHRLHFHGEIQCSADEAESVRKALRLASGEWDEARQHQTKTAADPDQGWASYIADDIWRVRFTRSFMPRFRDARSSSAITFTGATISTTKLLGQRAIELHAQHRAWLMSQDRS